MSIAGAAAVLGLRGDLLRFAIVEVTRSTLLASSAPPTRDRLHQIN
jgi:hypothetical protein